MLKNSARKSMTAFSPKSRVFLPSVKSSFLPAKVRALASERGSLPNVKGAGCVKAAGFQNGVVMGLKLDLLVCATPGTTLTRAAPVKWQPANKTSPAVPPHGPYTSVGWPDLYWVTPETYHPPSTRSVTPFPLT